MKIRAVNSHLSLLVEFLTDKMNACDYIHVPAPRNMGTSNIGNVE
jgi:hypothetical protein